MLYRKQPTPSERPQPAAGYSAVIPWQHGLPVPILSDLITKQPQVHPAVIRAGLFVPHAQHARYVQVKK